MTNRPCLDEAKLKGLILQCCKDNGFPYNKFDDIIKECEIGWFSRSMAASLFVFCKDNDGDWCVLASERGKDSADFQGYWNCPCGYLDYNETVKDCAIRECFEETGIKLEENELTFVAYEDAPYANRQNVTFRFAAIIKDRKTLDFKFSKIGNEGEEVGEIKWIKVNEIDRYKWAFNHDAMIMEAYVKFIGVHHWIDIFLRK